MTPIVDADDNSVVSAGEAARGAGSRWALPHILILNVARRN